MKRKIIFLIHTPNDIFFSKKYFLKKGKKLFHIYFYDISKLLKIKINQKKKKNIFKIRNFSHLNLLISLHNPDFAIITKLDEAHRKIIDECRKICKLKVCYLSTENTPDNNTEILKKIYFNLLIKKYEFFFIILTKFIFYILKKCKKIKYYFYSKKQFELDLALVSGQYEKTKIEKYKPKKIIECNNFDSFHSYKSKNQKNFSVFLDEDLYSHRDHKINKLKTFVTKKYFKYINIFFNNFEKKFKTKVIILLHPRTKNLKKYKLYFKGRKCIINQSYRFIDLAKYVLLHPSTTSINIPILLNKPIIFLTSDELMSNFEFRKRIEIRKKIFKNFFININSSYMNNLTNKIFYYDKKDYQDYIFNYINSQIIFSKPKEVFWDKIYKNL